MQSYLVVVVLRVRETTLHPIHFGVFCCAAYLPVGLCSSQKSNGEKRKESHNNMGSFFCGHQNALTHNDAAALHSSEAVEHFVTSLTCIC